MRIALTDPVQELAALLEGASAWDKARYQRLLLPEIVLPWHPEPTNAPQVAAFRSRADLLFYGGAAGGGKSDLLLGLALTAHLRAVIFGRTYGDLRPLEQRLLEIIGSRAGYNGNDRVLSRHDRVIEFGALEQRDSEFGWQGRAHDFIGFDEAAQLDEDKVRFVMGWLRSTTMDQRCRVVIASNAPVGAQGRWLERWFAPWLDPAFPSPAKPGELRWRCMRADGSIAWVDSPGVHRIDGTPLHALSCTFIPARLSDNRFLRDTGYRAQTTSLPAPLRASLLDDVRAGREGVERQVIPSAWIGAAQGRWKPGGARGLRMTTIGLALAQGGAEDTVLARLYGSWFAPLVKRGIDGLAAALVIAHRRDRCQVNLDLTGGWGGGPFDQLAAQGILVEPVLFSQASRAHPKGGAHEGGAHEGTPLAFLDLRTELWWRFREALDPDTGDGIALPPDPRLAAQLAAPTWTLRGSAIAIERREDAGATGDADAVILAWHRRAEALRRQAKRRG